MWSLRPLHQGAGYDGLTSARGRGDLYRFLDAVSNSPYRPEGESLQSINSSLMIAELYGKELITVWSPQTYTVSSNCSNRPTKTPHFETLTEDVLSGSKKPGVAGFQQTAFAPGIFINHRRIQDFVRGGPIPLGPPGSAPDYLGEQFFVRRGGGQGPLGPPGSAPVNLWYIYNKYLKKFVEICWFVFFVLPVTQPR